MTKYFWVVVFGQNSVYYHATMGDYTKREIERNRWAPVEAFSSYEKAVAAAIGVNRAAGRL